MQDFNQTAAYVAALAPGQILDWRCIHDTNKAVPAIPRRGTLESVYAELCEWNNKGYGVFVCVSALDGQGHRLENIAAVRAHHIDLDSISAPVMLQQASEWIIPPAWYVQTSAAKYHVYWPVEPYNDNERFTATQRRLVAMFGGDGAVIDATRVLRVPGFVNWKYGTPQSVTCAALPGYGTHTTIEALEAALAHVQVFATADEMRHDLGDPALSAPSLDWIKRALDQSDPNTMDRAEWLRFTAAIKQAGWLHASEDALFQLWAEWCNRYNANDFGENIKQWKSLRETKLGWPYVLQKIPTLMLGSVEVQAHTNTVALPELDTSGELLTHLEQQIWFKGCTAITRTGEILTPEGRFMKSPQFAVRYGGKRFIITSDGSKTTDDPWKAATRSTMWTVPKADHVRFLPELPFGEIVTDQLGRKGVNTYIPVQIKRRKGDVSPFLRQMQMMFPNESDRKILLDYMAHNIKFPGYKITWAPMIQSTEGVGKGFIQEMLSTILGEMYCYNPKANELANSGSKFNAWMRAKLLIIVDEIKVDERRELIEILKPMISDKRIEVQAKGIDQEMEDNCANWIFFSNFKDAIPINRNGRRYAIFYSAIQTAGDLQALGMDDNYFTGLFQWLRLGGHECVADYFLDYPIERGAIPGRAPDTSSKAEALSISRGPIERLISDATTDGLGGFRGGWVSVQAVHRVMADKGLRRTSDTVIEGILSGMGYSHVGRATRPYMQEDRNTRSTLFHSDVGADVSRFGVIQGYE